MLTSLFGGGNGAGTGLAAQPLGNRQRAATTGTRE